MSEGQTNIFDALESIQVKNRIKELEYDCAELQLQNEQLKAELLAELKHELLESKEKEDVAAKKIVNKRSTKRSRTATEWSRKPKEV